MRNVFKKLSGIFFTLLFLCMFSAPKQVKAEYGASEYITVSNVTCTTADANWAAMLSLSNGLYPDGIPFEYFDVYVGDTLVLDDTTQTSLQLTNLSANTRYYFDVYGYYYYEGDLLSCNEWEVLITGESLNSGGVSDVPSVTVPDTTPNTPTTTPVVTPVVPDNSVVTPESTYTPAPSIPVTVATPSIKKATIVDGTVSALAENVDVDNTYALEWQVYDYKKGTFQNGAGIIRG